MTKLGWDLSTDDIHFYTGNPSERESTESSYGTDSGELVSLCRDRPHKGELSAVR